MTQKLPKSERVSLKRQFDKISKEGKFKIFFPLAIKYVCQIMDESNTIAIKSSKKKIKSAVLRNKVKRRVKEAYRKNKFLLDSSHTRWTIVFYYLDTEIHSYKIIEKQIINSLVYLLGKKKQ